MNKGDRIKCKREDLNITQTELSKKIGVSKQTLYKYENNIITNIPSNKIEALAKCLNCSEGYIMGWDRFKYDPIDKEWFEENDDNERFYSEEVKEINKEIERYSKKLALLPYEYREMIYKHIDSVYELYKKNLRKENE